MSELPPLNAEVEAHDRFKQFVKAHSFLPEQYDEDGDVMASGEWILLGNTDLIPCDEVKFEVFDSDPNDEEETEVEPGYVISFFYKGEDLLHAVYLHDGFTYAVGESRYDPREDATDTIMAVVEKLAAYEANGQLVQKNTGI